MPDEHTISLMRHQIALLQSRLDDLQDNDMGPERIPIAWPETIPIDESDIIRMFDVESTGTAYQIKLLAGMAVRGEDYVGLLIDGSDPENLVISYDPDDTINLGVAIGVNYITLTWDLEADPQTHVTAGISATPAVENDGTVMPVAIVTVDGSGNVTDIEQMHRGVWWNDDSYQPPDDLSLNLNGSGALQDYGWATASPTTLQSSDDLLMLQNQAGETPSLAKYYMSYTTLYTTIVDQMSGGGGGIPVWPDNHSALKDIVAGTGIDDHNGSTTEGNYPYVSGRGAYDREGNAFATGSFLSDHSLVRSLTPDLRQLWDALGLALDWAEHELSGTWTMVDDDEQLIVLGEGAADGAAGGALSVAGGVDIGDNLWVLGDGYIEGDLGLTETTSHLVVDGTSAADGAAGGAVAVAGGVDVAGQVWALSGLKVSAINYWTGSAFYADTTSFEIGASTLTCVLGSWSLDIDSTSKAATWKKLSDITDPDQYVLVGDTP